MAVIDRRGNFQKRSDGIVGRLFRIDRLRDRSMPGGSCTALSRVRRHGRCGYGVEIYSGVVRDSGIGIKRNSVRFRSIASRDGVVCNTGHVVWRGWQTVPKGRGPVVRRHGIEFQRLLCTRRITVLRVDMYYGSDGVQVWGKRSRERIRRHRDGQDKSRGLGGGRFE